MLRENRTRVARLDLLIGQIENMRAFIETENGGVLSISCSNGERQIDVFMDAPRVEANVLLLALLAQEKAVLESELQTLE